MTTLLHLSCSSFMSDISATNRLSEVASALDCKRIYMVLYSVEPSTPYASMVELSQTKTNSWLLIGPRKSPRPYNAIIKFMLPLVSSLNSLTLKQPNRALYYFGDSRLVRADSRDPAFGYCRSLVCKSQPLTLKQPKPSNILFWRFALSTRK